MISLFNSKKGILETRPYANYKIEQIVHFIQQGAIGSENSFAADIQRLRNSENDNIRKVIKRKLPFVTWSGQFKICDLEHLEKYTGLLCIDFDPYKKIKGKAEIVNPLLLSQFNSIKSKLISDRYTAICFTSPSGSGIKVVAKLTTDPHKIAPKSREAFHKTWFEWISEYYKETYNLITDSSGKDIPRRCFLSHDSNIFFNPDAPVFLPSSSQKASNITVSIPGEHYPDEISTDYDPQIKKNSSGEYTYTPPAAAAEWPEEKQRWFHRAIQIAGQVNDSKIDITSDYDEEWLKIGCSLAIFGNAGRPLFHIISQFHSEYDYIRTNAKFDNLLKNLRFTTPAKLFTIARDYGIVSHYARKPTTTADRSQSNDQNNSKINTGNTQTNQIEKIIFEDQNKRISEGPFWHKTEKLSAQNKVEETTVKFSNHGLKTWLASHGFYRLKIKHASGSYATQFIKINGQIVTPLENEQNDKPEAIITDYIFEWMEKNNIDLEVQEAMLRGQHQYFTKLKFSRIPAVELDFKSDTKKESFLFFKNCFIKTSKTIEILSYEKLDKYIWKSQIINHDFTYSDDISNSEYFRFLTLAITEKETFNINDATDRVLLKKIQSFTTAIGYMLHGYKEYGKEVAPCIFDRKVKDENSEGGTGKSIVFKALGKLKPLVMIDGQNFDINKSDCFSEVSLDTALIIINDVKKNFDFTKFFHLITEGIRVKRLYVNPMSISYENSAKFGFTGNKPFKGHGKSFQRRQFILEFSAYWNKQSPLDFFGHELMRDDWDQDQWNMFYSFHIQCIKTYFEQGLAELPEAEYYLNKLLSEVPERFIEWCNEKVKLDTEYKKLELFDEYKEWMKQIDRLNLDDMKTNTFTKFLEKWCHHMQYGINLHKSDGRDRRNSVDYITIKKIVRQK